MKKIVVLLVATIFLSVGAVGQQSLNNYKYILVPRKYDFQKASDTYQINSLSKFLFNKAGFTTYYTDEHFPEDLASNRCLALTAVLKSDSGLFKTKAQYDFVDCNNKIVYTTIETFSKEKDFKKGFHDAIRKNFVEINGLNYSYKPKKEVVQTKAVVADKITVKENVINQKIVNKPEAPKQPNLHQNQQKIQKESSNNIIPKKSLLSLVGSYEIENWGTCVIKQQGDNFVLIGGDENLEIATIYKTSKPKTYIVKWPAFKQPQLVILTQEGNLLVDSDTGVKTYKKLR